MSALADSGQPTERSEARNETTTPSTASSASQTSPPQHHGGPPSGGSALYVYELDSSVNEVVLHAALLPLASKIASIRLGRDQMRQQPLGYAFINFRGADDAFEAAEKLQPLFVHNSLVRLAPFRDRSTFVRPPRVHPSQVDGVFVKNLHPDATAADLYHKFEQFGTISACRVALNDYGQSRGFAYITYEEQTPSDEDPVQKAIDATNNTPFVEGRRLFVGRNLPRQVRMGWLGDANSSQDDERNLFVKGIVQSVSDQVFYELFSSIGPLEMYTLPLDDLGYNRGFGFVRYLNHDDAERAISELQSCELHGSPLNISHAQQRGTGGSRQSPPELSDTSTGRRGSTPSLAAQATHSPANLYIRCIDSDVTDEMLEVEFSKFGPILSAKVILDDAGQSRRYGFVCFERAEDASVAIQEMNNRPVWGQNLYVARAQRKERRSNNGPRPPRAGSVGPQAQAHAQAQAQAQAAAMAQGYYYMPHYYAGMPYYYTGIPSSEPQIASGSRNTSHMSEPLQTYTENKDEPVPMAGLSSRQRGYGSSLAAAVASAADAAAVKQVIGEALYPKVLAHASVNNNHDLASRVTGIMLEQDTDNLLRWIDTEVVLDRRIQQAFDAYTDWAGQR